jgi:hypothetical protein
MATRRNRNQKRTRKGGLFGIRALKTSFENEMNCKFWSGNPSMCKELSKVIEYPGLIKTNLGRTMGMSGVPPTYKNSGKRVPKGNY